MLPHIDEHGVVVEAPPERVWVALGTSLLRTFGRGSRTFGALMGVEPLDTVGDPLTAGSTLPGFRVTRAEPPVELALAGEHRFSRYALVFRLEPVGGARARLCAETRAAFPHTHGRIYRSLVIGTRAHALVVRRLLKATKRRAER